MGNELEKEIGIVEQARPTSNSIVDIGFLVQQDIELRIRSGEAQYGQRLRPFNGRNALVDAYQEALDLAIYLRQHIEESRSKHDQG